MTLACGYLGIKNKNKNKPKPEMKGDAYLSPYSLPRSKTRGFMARLVLGKNKATQEAFKPELEVGRLCRSHCFRLGLIMRDVDDRMIIAPPLVMSHAQIDEMMALIRCCLVATLVELKAAGQLD